APRRDGRGPLGPGRGRRDRAVDAEGPRPDRGEAEMSESGVKVFVVDDHPLVRSGVRSELEGRVEVVGTAGDVDEAVTAIAAARPDVVLVDVHMPGGGGAELIRRVLAAADRAAGTAPASATPVPRVLALSATDAAEAVIPVS